MLEELITSQQHITFSFFATAAATGLWFASIPAAAILKAAEQALLHLVSTWGGEVTIDQLRDCMHVACKLPHAATHSAASKRGVQYRINVTISKPEVAERVRHIVTQYGLGQLPLWLQHAGRPVSSQPVIASMHEQRTSQAMHLVMFSASTPAGQPLMVQERHVQLMMEEISTQQQPMQVLWVGQARNNASPAVGEQPGGCFITHKVQYEGVWGAEHGPDPSTTAHVPVPWFTVPHADTCYVALVHGGSKLLGPVPTILTIGLSAASAGRPLVPAAHVRLQHIAAVAPHLGGSTPSPAAAHAATPSTAAGAPRTWANITAGRAAAPPPHRPPHPSPGVAAQQQPDQQPAGAAATDHIPPPPPFPPPPPTHTQEAGEHLMEVDAEEQQQQLLATAQQQQQQQEAAAATVAATQPAHGDGQQHLGQQLDASGGGAASPAAQGQHAQQQQQQGGTGRGAMAPPGQQQQQQRPGRGAGGSAAAGSSRSTTPGRARKGTAGGGGAQQQQHASTNSSRSRATSRDVTPTKSRSTTGAQQTSDAPSGTAVSRELQKLLSTKGPKLTSTPARNTQPRLSDNHLSPTSRPPPLTAGSQTDAAAAQPISGAALPPTPPHQPGGSLAAGASSAAAMEQ